MCTRATPRGRITLTGNTLKEVGEDTSETRIEEPEYETVLAERFGVVLEAPSWRVPLR